MTTLIGTQTYPPLNTSPPRGLPCGKALHWVLRLSKLGLRNHIMLDQVGGRLCDDLDCMLRTMRRGRAEERAAALRGNSDAPIAHLNWGSKIRKAVGGSVFTAYKAPASIAEGVRSMGSFRNQGGRKD